LDFPEVILIRWRSAHPDCVSFSFHFWKSLGQPACKGRDFRQIFYNSLEQCTGHNGFSGNLVPLACAAFGNYVCR